MLYYHIDSIVVSKNQIYSPLNNISHRLPPAHADSSDAFDWHWFMDWVHHSYCKWKWNTTKIQIYGKRVDIPGDDDLPVQGYYLFYTYADCIYKLIILVNTSSIEQIGK